MSDAVPVIPFVRITRPHIHARLDVSAGIIRLICLPVDVAHYRHLPTGPIFVSHSPDEGRLTAWVYTLSSRPETDPFLLANIAFTQCAL